MAAAFVALGILAIVARFSSGVGNGRTELPAFIDRSIGMWAIRRIRSRVDRRGTAPGAGAPPAAAPPHGDTAPAPAGRGRWRGLAATERPGRERPQAPFAGTPERITAVGARRVVPDARAVPTARPPARLAGSPATRPVATRPPVSPPAPQWPAPVPSQAWSSRIAPRATWSSRGPASAPKPALVPEPSPTARPTIQARHVALAGTVLTLGLIVLVGIAAILGPGTPSGGVLGTTGQPATTGPSASQASPSPSPSPRS